MASAATRPPIAHLQVDEAYRPSWFRDTYPSHIPLPASPLRKLPGQPIATGTIGSETTALVTYDGKDVHTQFDWETWTTYILEERYRDQHRPLYTRLPLHYHRVPPTIRRLCAGLYVRRLAGTSVPRNTFPGYPIEQGFELLQHAVNKATGQTTEPPDSPTLLTHDIDTAAGFDWVKPIASLEMAFNRRSIWYVVGCQYRLSHEILDWLVENGFEIGLHGYNHDNKLAFLSPDEIRRRLDRCLPLIERYNIRRFRSPSWFRNRKLYGVVRDYFEEDQSCPDTDVCCPGGLGGCLQTRPFTIDGLRHTPTTVFFDATKLFGHPPERWLPFWKPKIEWLRDCGGHTVVMTHPDPHLSGHARAMKAYERLLVYLTTTTKAKASVALSESAPTPAMAATQGLAHE